jgi:hypothetical protein
MAVITLVLGTGGLAVAGFVAWSTMGHRRMAKALVRVPVLTDRSAQVRRRDADLTGDRVR